MAVNTQFFSTLNELMGRAMGDAAVAVVDYDSFVDAGKILADMEITQLTNNFLSPLMNKVQKTINDNPSYSGSLVDMYRGSLDYGVLEVIMGSFYDMSASTFDGQTLVDGQTYTDQFMVNLPEKSVTYFTDSNSWELDITIRDTDLRAAFRSASAMDSFIATIMIDVANSMEVAKESARLGTHAAMIKTAAAEQANTTDETMPAVNYNLLAIYNATHDTNLDKDECMNSDDFIRFAVATIRDIRKLMTKPTTKFNANAYKTFTPASYTKLKVNSLFDKAIKVAVIDAYNVSNAVLEGDYEVLPFWQSMDDRMRITTTDNSTFSPSVIATLYDERAIGEMVQLEATESTRNAKRRYTNYHFQENYMYWRNENANFIIFTIG